jgi:hypothetical protein
VVWEKKLDAVDGSYAVVIASVEAARSIDRGFFFFF